MFNLKQKLEDKLFQGLWLCYVSLNKQINLKTFKPANSFSSRVMLPLGGISSFHDPSHITCSAQESSNFLFKIILLHTKFPPRTILLGRYEIELGTKIQQKSVKTGHHSFHLQCLFSQGFHIQASQNLAAAVKDMSVSSCPHRKPRWQKGIELWYNNQSLSVEYHQRWVSAMLLGSVWQQLKQGHMLSFHMCWTRTSHRGAEWTTGVCNIIKQHHRTCQDTPVMDQQQMRVNHRETKRY